MGIAITKQGDTVDYGVIESTVDAASDITNLPTDGSWLPGSSALCLEDSSVWILGTDLEWHSI